MKVKQMRTMIANAIKHENETGNVAKILREHNKQRNVNLSEVQVAMLVHFVIKYVEYVPFYIEQAYNNSTKTGLRREMDQLINVLEEYWFRNEDIIPDHFGLSGLVDDAYVSLFLLQSLSNHSKNSNGVPLLEKDLTEFNTLIRGLIGEPAASILDQSAGATLATVLMSDMMKRFGQGRFGGFPVSNSYWNDAETNSMIDAQIEINRPSVSW